MEYSKRELELFRANGFDSEQILEIEYRKAILFIKNIIVVIPFNPFTTCISFEDSIYFVMKKFAITTIDSFIMVQICHWYRFSLVEKYKFFIWLEYISASLNR